MEGARRKVTEVKARMGVDGFKRDLGMGRSEVRAFFARFSEIFPDIETLLSSTVAADRKLAKGALAEFQAACETVKIYPHLLAVSEAPAARASELLARAQ